MSNLKRLFLFDFQHCFHRHLSNVIKVFSQLGDFLLEDEFFVKYQQTVKKYLNSALPKYYRSLA